MITCMKCAIKHITTASRIYGELHQGYANDMEHLSALLGELSCASDQLYDKQPDIAEMIRQDRIKILDNFIEHEDEPPTHRPQFEEYFAVLLGLLITDYKKENGGVA
jgi:hypothetical protein